MCSSTGVGGARMSEISCLIFLRTKALRPGSDGSVLQRAAGTGDALLEPRSWKLAWRPSWDREGSSWFRLRLLPDMMVA